MENSLMEENVGGLDKTIRALSGTISIIALAMDLVSGGLRWIVALIAFVGLYTSITSHCMPYSLLGFSTRKKTCD